MSESILTSGQVQQSINYTLETFRASTIWFIQTWVNTQVDGIFGKESAQAVARHQKELMPTQSNQWDGMIGSRTLDFMLGEALTGPHEHVPFKSSGLACIATDLERIEVHHHALSVRHDPTLSSLVSITQERGPKVILLGSHAFDGAVALGSAIKMGLQELMSIGVEAPNPLPDILSNEQEQEAILQNKAILKDPRSVKIIQIFVGAAPDGLVGKHTVQRISAVQEYVGLNPTGVIDLLTYQHLFDELVAIGNLNSLLRISIDCFGLDETGLVEVSIDDEFQHDFAAHSATVLSTVSPGASVVRVKGVAFLGGWSKAFTTLVHEFEHVRQVRVGLPRVAEAEFLGHSAPFFHPESLLLYWREVFLSFDSIYDRWEDLWNEEKVRQWERFVQLRVYISDRANIAATHETLTPDELDFIDGVKAKFVNTEAPQ